MDLLTDLIDWKPYSKLRTVTKTKFGKKGTVLTKLH